MLLTFDFTNKRCKYYPVTVDDEDIIILKNESFVQFKQILMINEELEKTYKWKYPSIYNEFHTFINMGKFYL